MSSTAPPRVAIVGRPNVGKSTLLNRLVNSRVSIVEPTEGVTRDRVAVRTQIPSIDGERTIEFMDTGGIGIVDRDDLSPHVEAQVEAAMLSAQAVLFMVDVRSGLTPLDRSVAQRLRSLKIPVLLVANKAEGDRQVWEVDQFRQLGVGGDPLPISAQNGEGIDVLLRALDAVLPPPVASDQRLEPSLRLAIVGRRNAGKSTFVNSAAREERMIVSEVPGTTRDAVDVVLERDGETWVLIDTAGLRKKSSFEDAIEFYADSRSHRAIRRADVVLILFDASQPLSGIEKRLVRYAVDHHKPFILGANKWDLCRDRMEPEQLSEYLHSQMPGISYAPLALLSSREGFQVDRVLGLARELHHQAHLRVTTGELNRVLAKALEARSPDSRGHLVRIHYATQAERTPPTIVLFVNDKSLIGKQYLRYLENRLREDLPFKEVPLHLVLRDNKSTPDEEES
jgi:GTPase